MKKLFVVALAAMAMVSCVMNEEVVEVKGGDAIAFADAFLDNATRAAVDPSFTPNQGENPLTGFNVWAFMDDVTGTVFEAEDVTKSGDAWTYVNTQYWAPNHTYYFAALAPMDSANATVTPSTDVDASKLGLGKVEFTNVDGSEDLVYAKKSVTTAADINQQPAPVKLQFQHLLSKVKFTFVNGFTNENATLKITEIKMFAPKTGTIDLAVADYAEDWELGADEAFAFGDLEVAELSIGAKAESAKERLMIPAAADHKYVITFTAELYMGDVLAQTFEETTELTGIKFEMGKGYNLTAELNGGNLGLYPITFEVDVTEWDEYTDVTVDPRVKYVSNITELQAALDAATAEEGYNIFATADITGDAVATQKAGVNIVLDGQNHKFNGSLYINGQSSTSTNKSLVVKNFKFETADANRILVGSQYGNNTDRYARNITIENCIFTGSGVDSDVVAVKLYQAYDIAIVGCKATEVHSLAQISSSSNVTVTDCTVDGGRGVNMGNAANGSVEITKLTVTAHEADGYGVRIYTGAGKVATIENCTLNAFSPIVLKTNTDYTLYVNGCTLNATGAEAIVKEAKHVVYVDGLPVSSYEAIAKVATVDELKAALNNKEVILLAAGEYDLNDAVYYLNTKTLLKSEDAANKATVKGKLVANADFTAYDVKFAYNAQTATALSTSTYGSLVNNNYAAIVTVDKTAATFEGCEFEAEEGCAINYSNEAEGKVLTVKNCVFNKAMVYTKINYNIDNNTFDLGNVPYPICIWPSEEGYNSIAYFTNNAVTSTFTGSGAESQPYCQVSFLSRAPYPYKNMEFNCQGNTGNFKWAWNKMNAATFDMATITFVEGSKTFNF